MRHKIWLGSCLVVAFTATACQDQITEAPVEVIQRQANLTAAVTPDRSQLNLPAILRNVDLTTTPAINPNDYVCVASTPVQDFYLTSAFDIIDNEPAVFNTLYNVYWADLLPTYEALYVATTATPQYFGYNGEYTHIMVKAERYIKRFWDIPSGGIQVIGMHGSMLLDSARVAAFWQTFRAITGLPIANAAQAASVIRNTVLQSTTVDGGNHPLFSFNAFAISAPGFIPDKIVMGDGILAGYESLGFGDVAAQGIFAHEFGHHIQFANDYFENDVHATTGTAAERTRYTELMADAYAAYWLTHKRGAALNQKRVEQFLEVFYQIGDCGFTSSGHHGTQNQRMRAAQFGFDIADQAHKQGHIMSSEAFHALFVAEYPTLIAPDAL
jgi:hypothetical protein